LLQTLPDTPERAQHELTLQIFLGNALMHIKGFVAPEVEKTYGRARELCQQMGEVPQLLPMLQGLRVFYLARGELQTEHKLAEQIMRLAQSVQDPLHLLIGHSAQGESLFHQGKLVLAQQHFEQCIALYPSSTTLPSWSWLDGGVVSLSFAALVLWLLGYPDQALKRNNQALTRAQKLSHPLSLAWALRSAVVLHRSRHEEPAAQERTEALIVLSTEQGVSYMLAQGTILGGWALAAQGQVERGISQMRQELTSYQATGAELWCSYFFALLAEAYGEAGQVEEGLTALAKALALVVKTGARWWEAELYRLQGELTLQKSPNSEVRSPKSEAEECFLKAIEIARRQQAKSLELRAVMSLSRLWQSQGKEKEAHQMLVEIYHWFTEGFDTKDLREAKALLEELT
jgi:predicted ATPase